MTALFGQQLCERSGGAGHLSAFAGPQLNIVNLRTQRNIPDRQSVSRENVRILAAVDRFADLQAYGRDDVTLLAVKISNQRDVRRAIQIEYDPNRSSNIALLTYLDGEKRYIIAPAGLEVGKMIASGEEADILPGNALPIRSIPLGTQIHNIELRPGKGGQMARAAGSFAQLLAKEGQFAQLRMPSGEVRRVPVECRATVGQVGNVEHENVSLGKAGRSRWKGIRPHVRGVAMNPVDHPHGGGEGKTSGGRNPVTPWGQPTRGYKTRSNKRTQRMILKDRRTK